MLKHTLKYECGTYCFVVPGGDGPAAGARGPVRVPGRAARARRAGAALAPRRRRARAAAPLRVREDRAQTHLTTTHVGGPIERFIRLTCHTTP